MVINLNSDRKLFLLGDIHGNTNYFDHMVKKFNVFKNSYFIQVGDFGVGFKNRGIKWLENFNEFLKSNNIIMYVIRGNHDDVDFFDGTNNYSNLILLEDYSVLTYKDKNFLLVGGGISVDRMYRIEQQTLYPKSLGLLYFEGEEFKLDYSKIEGLDNITDVITHSAPDITKPIGKLPAFIHSFAERDKTLLNDLKFERSQLSDMFYFLKRNNSVINWYYGHFHDSYTYDIENTNFKLLDVNEIYEYDKRY